MIDGARLCLLCGLCCDGSLFGRVRLGAAEAERMIRLGQAVATVDGQAFMKQPCTALAGLACRIYEDRPERCSAFRCNLLAAFEADELDLTEAEAIVQGVRNRTGPERTAYVALHFLGRT